jgi:hypothetical protein
MNDDELRDRINDLDPMHPARVATTPTTAPEARALLEDIMTSTPDIDEVTPATSDADPRRRRIATIGAAAAAVVAIVALGAVVASRDDDGDDIATPVTATPSTGAPDVTSIATTLPDTPTVLELQTGTEDLLASCAVIDASIVAQAPVAFKGTVTSADGDVVQLTVDEAYAGVTEQAVTLTAPEGMEALIGGVAWEVGQTYLVTAYDGVVSYCGQTGPATPELQAIFDQAFPG